MNKNNSSKNGRIKVNSGKTRAVVEQKASEPGITLAEKLKKYKGMPEYEALIPAFTRLSARYLDSINENRSDAVFSEAIEKIGTDYKNNLADSLEAYEKIVRMKSGSLKKPLEKNDLINIKSSLSQPVRGRTSFADTVSPAPDLEYALYFDYLRCKHESERRFIGFDNPFIVFMVTTENMARQRTPWEFQSITFSGIRTDEIRPEKGSANKLLYGFTGPAKIDSRLWIDHKCINAVNQRIDDVMKKIKTAMGISSDVSKILGEPVTADSISLASKLLSLFVDFAGKSYQIGVTEPTTLENKDIAYQLTYSSKQHEFTPIVFDGGEYYGIYEAYLKLCRK